MSAAKTDSFPYTSIVLTGGSSGIGKSFLKHMENQYPNVRICNLSRRSPEGFSAQLKLRHITTDLSDSTSRQASIAEVLDFLLSDESAGSILLINNAGLGSYGEFHKSNAAKQREVIEVNLNAVIDLTSALLPLLEERGGVVMNIASVTAFQPTPYIATYGATKVFLLQWGYSLGHELKDTGVRILTVCPGSTDTAFHSRAGMAIRGPLSRFAQTPDQVVKEAMQALASGKSHVVTGWSNKIMTKFSTFLPSGLVTRMSGSVLSHLRADRS